MKRLTLLALAVVAGAVTAAACGGPKPPPQAPTPQPNADSAAAAERARQDSMDAANRAAQAAEAERARRQQEADAAAGAQRTTEEVRAMLNGGGFPAPVAASEFVYDSPLVPFDPAPYGGYPALLAPALAERRFHVLYADGAIVGRSDVGPRA